jgi:hypothetical protein
MPSTPLHRGRDQRVAERFDATMPVTVAGLPGETRNISARGIYFESDVQQRVGSLVNFTVEYTLQGRKHRLLCEGKVVRVEQQGGRVGVAARLVAPFFEEEGSTA